MEKLKVLDLFSGIGGFSLGLERTGGFETVAFCEIEDYPRKVLTKHWPEVPIYEDVRNVTAKGLAADGIFPSIITGGFPCQDISVAGKQAGIGEGTRSGLWSECARLLGELRPQIKYAIFENVTALLSGDRGRWFQRVLFDLSSLGYSCQWHCISASELGAHHHRDRIWIICTRNDYGNACQKIKGSVDLQTMWRAIPTDQNSEKERVLFSSMLRKVEIISPADTFCCCERDVCGEEPNNEGNSEKARNDMEACQQGSQGQRGRDERRAESQEEVLLQDVPGASGEKNWQAIEDGRNSSSPRLRPNEQQDRKSCSCIEAAAWKTSQAIGDNLSAALQKGANYIQPPSWVSDYSGVSIDESLRTSELGAHHHRDRVWIVAYPSLMQRNGGNINGKNSKPQIPEPRERNCQNAPNTMRPRLQGSQEPRIFSGGRDGWVELIARRFRGFPEISEIEPTICGSLNGIPGYAHRLKGLGNAVVPQTPELIGRAILENYA